MAIFFIQTIISAVLDCAQGLRWGCGRLGRIK
jgi:hypothetical protein